MKTTVVALAFAMLANTSIAAAEPVLLPAEDDWYLHSAKVGAEAQGCSTSASTTKSDMNI
jgi:hypothetical protein